MTNNNPDYFVNKHEFTVIDDETISLFTTHGEFNKLGVELFKERQIDADLVTAVPKGGIPAAVGYAKASGLPYSIAILEEPTTGGLRSFITSADERQAFARMKYSVLADVVKGKKIVVIDDSIVRGTTAKLLVKSLFLAGAKEVHLRIPAPPYDHPCNYGIETKDPETLISHGRSEKEVCDLLQIDPSTLWHWVKNGRIKKYGIGKRRYYKRNEIMESLIAYKND